MNVDVDVDGNGDVEVGDPSNLRNRFMCRPIRRTMLTFQRLDVYQRSIEFLALVYEVVDALPRGHAERADQLIRAAESVIRNIAEGAGRWSDADTAKHYKIARGEAMECAGSLDVLRVRKQIAAEHYDRANALLERMVGMLTKMI